MWQILQQDTADDFVIGRESHSVREFVEASFAYAAWTGQKHVKMSDRYLRPLEVRRAHRRCRQSARETWLGIEIEFRDLVAIMVDADVEAAGLTPRGEGKAILEKKIGHWNRWHNSVTRMVQAVSGQAFAALKGQDELLE